jgi:hypothetical protein
VYLPAYSPDFNPIEEGFAALKAWIRRHGAYVCHALNWTRSRYARHILKAAVYEVMVWLKTIGWWSHSGYCVKEDYTGVDSE